MRHRSLWLQEALQGERDAPALAENTQADVCIIGGGYTGLWTALRIKEHEPSADVVILEADICGGGASGRNAGFCQSAWYKFLRMKSLFGTEEAVRLCRALDDAVSGIASFCDQHDIDAQFRRDGWLWAATNKAQIGVWNACIAELARHEVHTFRVLEPEELSRLGRSDAHLAGVIDDEGATIQPALLVRGLRRVALAMGVRIFEHSPMVALKRTRPPVVQSPAGGVTAERVVLALNAWSGRVRELSRWIVTVSSEIVVTEPVPDLLRRLGWLDGLSVADAHLLPNYYRITRDQRFLFGKGGQLLAFGAHIGSGFNGRSRHERELIALMGRVFPLLAEAPIATSWAGPIDRTASGLPFFGHLGGRPDLLYGAGYSGIGIGPSFLGGRILAALALGLEDEWSTAGFVNHPAGRFPPEPIRFLGGRLVKVAVAHKERKEDQDKKPGPLTEWLAAQAPPGYNYQPPELSPTTRGTSVGSKAG